jgi:O-antigen ligase
MVNAVAVDTESGVRDTWVFWGVLALIVWAPLPIGSNRLWAGGLLICFAIFLLLGTALAWRRSATLAFQRLRLFRWPLGVFASMVMLAWLQTAVLPASWVAAISPNAAAIQAPAPWMTLSLDVYQSRYMAALSFAYFAVFLVVLLTVRHAGRLDKLAQVLVWSGVLQTVLGAVLFSMKAEYRIFFTDVEHTRMIGTFVYHNSLAGYLCMCLSIGVGLMLARLSGHSAPAMTWKARMVNALKFILSDKMRLRLLLIVMVIGLVLTRSRMGNTAFFAALLIVGSVAIVLARKTAPKTIMLIASLIVIDVLVIGTWVGLEKVVERVQDTEVMIADGGKSESIEARSWAARTAIPIVMDYPLVGTGGGSFYNLFLSYRSENYGAVFWDHAHNDFVEIATDFGLLGLGILGLLVALTLWTVIKVMARRKSALPWGIAFGVAMSVVALLVHSAVDFNLQIPANAMTMVIILAMGWLSYTLPSKASASTTKHPRD